jgi:hypothetical protein
MPHPAGSSDTSGLGTQSAPGPFLCCVAHSHTTKAAKVSLDGSPLRCVCVEVCCVERCSKNVAVPTLPWDARSRRLREHHLLRRRAPHATRTWLAGLLPSTMALSVGCNGGSGGKGQEQTQIIAKAIGRPTPTALPSIITKSRSRPVPT